MSVKIGDDNKKYLIKWDDASSELRLLTYEYTTWNSTYSQYDMSLSSTKVLSYTNPFLYGYDTTTQTNLTASTAHSITFNTIVATHSINIVDGSKITFYENGLYNLQFSAQLDKTDAGDDDIDIWFSKNGSDIPWSNSQLTVHGNNGKALPSWNFFENVNIGDYIEIKWSSADHDMRILSIGTQSGPVRPAIPSVIITVNKIYTQYNK